MRNALIAVFVLACCSIGTAAQRNVLLMIGDDQGLDGACFGNPACDTPNLDRLAGEGTRFAEAYACVSSCSPSRSVILTGLYNHTNGQYGLAHASNNQVTQPWVMSLPRLLNDAGYITALIGKNHVQPEAVYPYQVKIEGPSVNRQVQNLARKASEVFVQEKPFFVVAAFHDPHRAGKGFQNEVDYPGVTKHVYDPAKVMVPYFLPDDSRVREDIADYYQSVNRMDQGVGMVLEALAKSGKADNTLVIYVSDNGMPFPGAKCTLYDAGVKLPMVARVPGQKGGVVSQAMVSYIDIAPTALEWTGVKAPQYGLPGRSLLSIMDQPQPAGWDQVFASHTMHEVWMNYPMRMIRTRDFKLIWNLNYQLNWPIASDINGSASQKAVNRTKSMGQRSLDAYMKRPEFELFDMKNDPNELKNLAGDDQHARVRDELKQKLLTMMKDTKDPWMPLVRAAHDTQ